MSNSALLRFQSKRIRNVAVNNSRKSELFLTVLLGFLEIFNTSTVQKIITLSVTIKMGMKWPNVEQPAD